MASIKRPWVHVDAASRPVLPSGPTLVCRRLAWQARLVKEEAPMKHSILLALAALTIFSVSPAAAAAPAPFGCDARAGQICYFKIYYSPRRTRIVQLPTGVKVNIPDVVVGRDTYCVSVGKPPANKCTQKTINATYNN
jgi:hypothetical protein